MFSAEQAWSTVSNYTKDKFFSYSFNGSSKIPLHSFASIRNLNSKNIQLIWTQWSFCELAIKTSVLSYETLIKLVVQNYFYRVQC